MYAVEAATSEERWQRPQDADVWQSAPAVADDRIFFGSSNGDVRALRTTDGSRVWLPQVNEMDSPIHGPVAVAEWTVYAAGRGGTIAALDATDGQVAWTGATEAYELGPPAVGDGVVYVGEPDMTGSGLLFAFDSSNGDERWRVETRAVPFGDHTRVGIKPGIAIIDELVCVATAPGELYAIHGRS